MLYDLNIAWSPTTTATELDATLRWAAILGYGVVALNHTIRPPIPSKILNPIPRITGPLPTSSTQSAPKPPFPRILTRATVTISDPAHNHRLPDLASTYDILALRPATEKAFQAACTSFSEHSLISLDLTAPLGFHIRPKPAMAAVDRGLHFEVCYGQLHYGAAVGSTLGPSGSSIETPGAGSGARTDDRGKAIFLSNLAELVRATRGRGIVLSSEAKSALAVRGAADVVNLMSIYGLRSEMGMKAVKENPRLVVANEGIKRTGFRGVVDVVTVAEKPKDAETKEGNDETDGGKKKRKSPDDTAEGGGQGGQEQGGMSKRQAKKMRLALRKQQEEMEKGKGKVKGNKK